MAKKNRETLKARFKKGRMPSEDAFADLIDSALNLFDDGFERTPEDGFKIFQLGDGKLISFYQKISTLSPMWFVRIDKTTTNLNFGNENNPYILTLKSVENVDTGSDEPSKVGVGININNPQFELDVAGTIASYGRIGRRGQLAVPADGEWHAITETLTGCEAFEVVAGVGGKDADGKFALMHAFALNAYNAKNHITYHQAHYGAKCNRLELRWENAENTENFEYTLQLRVESFYGDNIWVKYHVTRLWHDPMMFESEKEPESTYPKVLRKRQVKK
ncbi:hypothetical protein [Nitrosomonas supralitoralis]|uniref:Uncharacterized protein n=1 Tax=Nitrosomonas supralitoralis TaxID=2116706 RepID=A0A2P7NZQ0_9PROT|nr:hypothetical protein [Nitrosomonas supralitoralis]PSJ18962.1 hypothetical protein C7H79_00580 [Nitrosomonas supralitoralis]